MSSKDTQKAFLEVYETHSDILFRYCFFKTSDREKSVDLVQDSFVRFWEQVKKEEEIQNPKALLFRIANNLIIDWYRKRKASSLDEIREKGFDIIDENESTPEIKIDSALLLKKLELLEPTYREVILLRYVEDMSVKDIADIIGEKENTVSVRIHRAIEKLQKLFNT